MESRGIVAHDQEMFVLLLDALGAGLQACIVDIASDLTHHWIVSLVELSLNDVDDFFPLARVLGCCAMELRNLKTTPCSTVILEELVNLEDLSVFEDDDDERSCLGDELCRLLRDLIGMTLSVIA